jgi:hypothetical protein
MNPSGAFGLTSLAASCTDISIEASLDCMLSAMLIHVASSRIDNTSKYIQKVHCGLSTYLAIGRLLPLKRSHQFLPKDMWGEN